MPLAVTPHLDGPWRDLLTHLCGLSCEKAALEYADRITITELDVSEQFFANMRHYFSDDEIVELTVAIAWENCSSKFNRALRVDSQQLWGCGEA